MVGIPNPIGLLRRGGGSGMEGPTAPAPRVEARVNQGISQFEARRLAGQQVAAGIAEAAKIGGPEVGLAALVQEPPVETANKLVGVEPRGPERWMGNVPRSDVDSAAIDQMGEASARHTADENLVSGTGVASAVVSETGTQSVEAPPAFSAGPAQPEPAPTDGPEPTHVPVLPITAMPDLTYGRGLVVGGPNTSGATTAAIEAKIGPSIIADKPNLEAQQPLQPPLPDAADLGRMAARLLTKNSEEYLAMDAKAKAEYLKRALDIYLENPSAIRLDDGDYAKLAGRMAGNSEVSQDETIKYAIDSTLRLINDKDGRVMKNLFPALEHHPELKLLITQATDKMGLNISLEDKKALINASEVSKGLFLIILMLVLNLSKEMLVGGVSDQRR